MPRCVPDEHIEFPFKIADLFVKQPMVRRQPRKKYKRIFIGGNQIQPIVNGPQGCFKNLFRQCQHLRRVVKQLLLYDFPWPFSTLFAMIGNIYQRSEPNGSLGSF